MISLPRPWAAWAGLLMLAACSSTSPAVPAPAQGYKLFISAGGLSPQGGLYRVTADQLARAGAEVEKVDAATLQLFLGDREVPIRVSGESQDLVFEFYGLGSESAYSPFSVYWLRWGAQAGIRMRQVSAPPASGPPAESFADTVSFAQRRFYVPQARGAGDHWFWQSLAAPVTASVTITLPAALPAAARLLVNLWGSSQDEANPDHHVRVFLNDVMLTDEWWDGAGAHAVDVAVPAPAVREGANTLRLTAPADTRAKADIVLLKSIDVTYTRRFTAQGDTLEFRGSRGNYRVDGFGDDRVEVFDITDTAAPVQVANVAVKGGALSFSTDSAEARRWYIAGAAARRAVERIAPLRTANLREAGARVDYLVITPSEFADAVLPLKRWREGQGLAVRVVTTDEIYDEFGYGAESPEAIRALLAHAYQRWPRPAPRFVLLVGKASYDTRDYLRAPNRNRMPTFLRATPHLGETGADNAYVAFDEGSARPAMAIGRLPVRTPEQLAVIVGKIIAYESAKGQADWRARALFVADDKEPDFENMSESLIRGLPVGMDVTRAYLRERGGTIPAKRAVLEAWNRGVAIVSYIGHGSIDSWAAGPLFSSSDVPALRNGSQLPFLLTPTCLDGFFLHPQQDSLVEQLLVKPDGGIIAGLAPTGLSLPSSQAKLNAALWHEQFVLRAPTLGEAILRAKQSMTVEDAADAEVVETFTLLGDPATRLAVGQGE